MISKDLSDFFEHTIVDSFIKFINERDNLNYTFSGRPDLSDRSTKAPDFKYIDKNKDRLILVELSRLTVIDLGKYQKIRSIYRFIKDELEGKIKGSFLLVIDSEQECISRMARGGARRSKIQNIIDNIMQRENKMEVRDKVEVGHGVLLSKYSKDNSSISIEPPIFFANSIKKQKNLIDVFEEANMKFASYTASNSTNIMILLDTSSIFHDITMLLEFSDIILPERNIDLKNIDEIYEIELNSDWNITPIGLSQCYPGEWSKNWCMPSELFENQKKYRKAFYKYFMGSDAF